MKQLLLPFLTATLLGFTGNSANAAIYEAYEASGSVTFGYLSTPDEKTGGVHHATVKENYVEIFSFTPLVTDQQGKHNIEWLDGRDTLTYPASCRILPEYVGQMNGGFSTRYSVSAFNEGQGVNYWETYANSLLPGASLSKRVEPVNRNGTSTGQLTRLPRFVECDASIGAFDATGVSVLSVQKWWDGVLPNVRTSTMSYTVKYRATSSIISAAFKPDTIQLTGKVKDYITTNSVLVITTTGGTKVEIVWPSVGLLEYEHEGVWTGGHDQQIAVTDGENKVDKRIRVRGTVPGHQTISVPVTMTIS